MCWSTRFFGGTKNFGFCFPETKGKDNMVEVDIRCEHFLITKVPQKNFSDTIVTDETHQVSAFRDAGMRIS